MHNSIQVAAVPRTKSTDLGQESACIAAIVYTHHCHSWITSIHRKPGSKRQKINKPNVARLTLSRSTNRNVIVSYISECVYKSSYQPKLKISYFILLKRTLDYFLCILVQLGTERRIVELYLAQSLSWWGVNNFVPSKNGMMIWASTAVKIDRTSVFSRRTFSLLRSTCIWWVTSYVGKPSAAGQPTRLTQPFILPRSINK